MSMRLALIESPTSEVTQITAYDGRTAVAQALIIANDGMTRDGLLETVEAFRADPLAALGQ